MKKFLLMLVFALSFFCANAAYLRDVPVTVTQPDGTELKCYASGDELNSYLHDADGCTIIQDSQTGYYVYDDNIPAVDMIVTEPFIRTSSNCETFLNIDITPTYHSGTFTGQDGSTWSYDLAKGGYHLNASYAITIRAKKTTDTGYGFVKSGSLMGGCSSLTFDYYKPDDNESGNWDISVLINNTEVGTITSAVGNGTFSVDNLTVLGNFTIKIVNNSTSGSTTDTKAFKIVNICWEGYEETSIVETPIITPESGTYSTPQQVTIAYPSEVSITTKIDQGFEGGTIPVGWRTIASSQANWYVAESSENGNVHAHTGTYAAFCNGVNYNYDNAYLITPAINLMHTTSASLNYYYMNKVWIADANTALVYYGLTSSGPWNLLWSTNIGHSDWTYNSINLDALCGKIIYIAFASEDNFGLCTGFDDIKLVTGKLIDIYYTLDGSTPTNTSTLYTNPFNVSSNTSVKATAYSFENSSAVASATYSFPVEYANIAAFKAAYTATSSEVAIITGDVTFVYRDGRYIYVQDATGGLLIYDNATPIITNTYQNGDVISGGICGTYTKYNGLSEMIPTQNPAAGIPGTEVQPIEVTAANIVDNFSDYENLLVKIVDASFNNNYTFGNSTIFTQSGTTMTAYNRFGNVNLSVTAGDDADIIGFASVYNTTYQVFPRDNDDIMFYYDITSATITGGSVTASLAKSLSGETITLSNVPETNYTFDHYVVYETGNVTNTITVDGNVFAMPEFDVTVSAVFNYSALGYSISIASGIENGSISASAITAPENATITITSSPSPGYELESLYYYTTDPTATTNINMTTMQFDMPAANVTVGATFISIPIPGLVTYDLITSTDSLVAGAKYIIVGNNNDIYKAMGYQRSNNRGALDVTLSMNSITLTPSASSSDQTSVYEFTLGGETGAWTLYDPLNSGYLYAAGSGTSGNYLRTQEINDDNGKWAITFNANGSASIIAQGNNTKKCMQYNYGSSLFSCYSSANQNPVYLYKAKITPVTYTISVASGIENGTITVDKASASEGETITVTGIPSVDYELTALYYYTTDPTAATNIDMTTMQFDMPAADVTVGATFTYSVEKADTPTFSVAEGFYYNAQSVEISCETPGASIYYTLDGSTPDNTSIMYGAPIVINSNTIVKAIAYAIDYDPSIVASATYSFPVEYANIAAFKAVYTATSTEIARITGDVTFVYRNGRYIYVQDATAGLLIYDNATPIVTNTYLDGDIISGGICGTYTKYNGLSELIPTQNPAAGTPGTDVQPIEVTATNIVNNFSDYESRLVKIVDASFNENYTFGNLTTFTQSGTTMTAYNRFGNVNISVTAGDDADIIGFVSVYNTTKQVFPRDNDDIMFYYDITSATITGGSVTASLAKSLSGETITLSNVPEANYTLDHYVVYETGNETNTVTVDVNVFAMPEFDVTVSAVFNYSAPGYSISIASGIENGNISASAITAPENATITITSSPSAGYELTALYYYTTDPTATTNIDMTTMQFNMPAANVTIGATFTLIPPTTYIVNIASGIENGTITIDKTTALEGETITVTDTPSTGYQLESLYYYTTDPTATTNIDMTTKQFGMPAADVTVGATFSFIPVPVTYGLISSTDNLVAGAKYIIVGDYNDIYKAMGYQKSSNRHAVDVTLSMSTITLTPSASSSDQTSVYEFTLGGATGAWTLYDPLNSGYLYAASSSSNHLKTQEANDANSEWDITFNANGSASIIAQGSNSKKYMQYNSGSSLFSCYGSASQRPVYLYKAGFTPATYTVSVASGIENGTIIVDKTTALEGETITVTGIPSINYELTALYYYTTDPTAVTNIDMTTMQFNMPAANVTIGATFTYSVEKADTPTFSVAEGFYYNAQSVEISCETPGASIYYTLDGSTPDNTSILYGAPIVINSTTTVKAIAYAIDYDPSIVASATYSFPVEYANIAAFKAAYTATSTEIARITGDVTFVYRDGHYIYVQDATAGLLIYDNATPIITNTYLDGDVISGGICGTYTKYNDLSELIPTQNPAAGTPGTDVQPIEVTATNIVNNFSDYESRLVKIVDASFDENYTFGNLTTFTQSGTTMTAYNRFGNVNLSVTAGDDADIIGFASVYNTTYQVFPRDNDDIMFYYDITSATITGGSVTASLAKSLSGETITLSNVPEANYTLDHYVVYETGNETNTVTVDGSVFTMPEFDVTVSAVFNYSAPGYSISIASGIENGTIIVDKTTAIEGETITVTDTPSAGYELTAFYYYTTDPTATTNINITTKQFDMPAADVTVGATFTLIPPTTYNINIASGIENGTITIDKTTALEGETITVTDTPSTGYQLESLYYYTTDPTATTNINITTKQFDMPAADVTVGATFTLIPPTTYIVNIASGIENGTITIDKTTAIEGETITVTDTPSVDYELTALYYYTTDPTATTNIDITTKQFDMPAADVTVGAVFSIINSYTITASSNPVEGGTITGAGTYVLDETCTLNALANIGYTFMAWTEEGVIVSTNANYSFTVNEDRILVANFTLTPPSILGDANNDGSVSVLDILCVINYILGHNPSPFIFENADVNFDNIIDVVDVMGISNIILGYKVDCGEFETAHYSIENGILYIETPVALGGLQFTLTEEPETGEALNGFNVTGDWVNGEYIMIAYSMNMQLEPGKHAVAVTDAIITNIALSTPEGCRVNAVNTVSVNEWNENAYSIYPVPAKNKINVEGPDINKIEIFNNLGQIVLTIDNINVETTVIDMSNNVLGSYIIRISTNDGHITTKHIIMTK